MTRTAASNVQVLAAGTRQDQGKPETDSQDGERVDGRHADGVAEDAERIALAQSEGEIMLMLRNPLDTEPTVTTGVRTAALLGARAEPPAPVARPPAPRRTTPPPAPQPKVVDPAAKRERSRPSAA